MLQTSHEITALARSILEKTRKLTAEVVNHLNKVLHIAHNIASLGKQHSASLY